MKKILISLICLLSIICFMGCDIKTTESENFEVLTEELSIKKEEIYASIEIAEILNDYIIDRTIEVTDNGYIVKIYLRVPSNYRKIEIFMYYVKEVDGEFVAERMADISFE